MEQLRRQIELVISCFQYIHNHDGDLDLQLSISLHETVNTRDDQSDDSTGSDSQGWHN